MTETQRKEKGYSATKKTQKNNSAMFISVSDNPK